MLRRPALKVGLLCFVLLFRGRKVLEANRPNVFVLTYEGVLLLSVLDALIQRWLVIFRKGHLFHLASDESGGGLRKLTLYQRGCLRLALLHNMRQLVSQ